MIIVKFLHKLKEYIYNHDKQPPWTFFAHLLSKGLRLLLGLHATGTTAGCTGSGAGIGPMGPTPEAPPTWKPWINGSTAGSVGH